MTKSLQINLLGPFEIKLNGNSLTNHDWRSQQTQTIAKILIANAGKVVTSDILRDSLWPNDTEKITRGRLHVRISQLRNGLGDKKDLVRTVHGGYIFELDDSCWLDIAEFQSLLTKGEVLQEKGQQLGAIQNYEEARQLYRGDFLAEDLFSNWTFTQREFFRERFLSLLIELSECYAQQGRYRLAITRARQALNLDHLRETIYARLMLYYYYAGDRAQALRIFEHCRVVLKDELNVSPMESTLQLAAQIKKGTLWEKTDLPHYPPPIYEGRLFEVPYALSEIPFAGRDREYAWLVSQWNDPKKRVIFIEGDAGIGKSRLLEAFTGYLKSKGTEVLDAHLSFSEYTPFMTLIGALEPLLTGSVLNKLSPAALSALSSRIPKIQNRVTKLLPEQPTLPPRVDFQRFLQAASDLAAVAAADRPTLFVIDDAHRLNLESVDLLKYLSQSILILLSCRSEDTPPDHPIRTSFGESELRLTPLHDTAIHSIIQQLSGGDNKVIASQISTQSGGNPLFAVALLEHMFETGQLYVDSNGEWSLTTQSPSTLPRTLQNAIETRLGHLNRVQRRVLDFAAVIGGEFDFNLLKTAAQEPEDALLATLDELIDASLVAEPRQGGKPEFIITHDRYTEVAYETIPPVRRRGMHLQVARAVEQIYAGNLEGYFAALADHYDKAEELEKALHYSALAGEQAAAQFALTEALHYLSRSLELMPAEDVTSQVRLLFLREKVYDIQGKRQPQNKDLSALEALCAQLPMQQQAEIYLRRAAYEWIMGNYQNEMDAVNCAILKAKSCKAKDLEARAYYLIGISDDDMNKRIQYLNLAQKLSHEINYLALEADALRWLGNTAYWQNQYARSMEYLSQALSMHREAGDLRGELSALNNLGHLHKILGNLRQAANFYEQAHGICRKINDKLAEGVILTNRGGLALALGNFDTAQNTLQLAARIRSEIGNEEGLAMAENILGNLFRQTGAYNQSFEHYQKALEINTRIEHEKQTCETLNGLSALYRELGDFGRSQALLEQSFARNTDKIAPRHIQACLEGSLLSLYNRKPHKALSLGEVALTLSSEVPALKAAALKNIGHAMFVLGRMADAQEHFIASVSLYEQLGQSHLVPESFAGLAEIALSNQNYDKAITSVERILDIMGSQPLQGPDRLMWIYLTCYQVLSKVQDTRAAEIIEKAHQILDYRADPIPNESLRTSFLDQIQENKQISEIWKKQIKNH
jgi:predicted ATPase/DNA-binding SARP family transcriptional activator